MPYGQLKPEGYISRIVDSKLERLLDLFGAVEVAGTMWCGKTWTSLARAESVTRIGLSGPRSAAEADPSTALIGARPHLVDEWQDVERQISSAVFPWFATDSITWHGASVYVM